MHPRIPGFRLAGLMLLAALLPACGVGSGGATLTPTVAPGIPGNVVVRAGNRSATITWDASAAGAGYTVLRSLTSGGPYFPVSVPQQFRDATTYEDPGLLNGTPYYYRVEAWNRFGQSAPSTGVAVTPGFRPVAISATHSVGHLAAVLPDGSVWEWGGIVTSAGGLNIDVPLQVPNLRDIIAVSIASTHGLAIDSRGAVWGWGYDDSGDLGLGTSNSGFHPATAVPGIAGITAVAAGTAWSLALDHDGTVWYWGANDYGEAGNGTSGTTPVTQPQKVPGLTGIIDIAAGEAHALALRKDGLVYAWGLDDFGQVGDGTKTPAGILQPVLIGGLNGVIAIAAGMDHSLALRSDGTVQAWGRNDWGQLGDGVGISLYSPLPGKVAVLKGVTAIGAGQYSGYAVTGDGKAWAWGSNKLGSLGNGSQSPGNTATPTPVVNISGITAVAGSWNGGMALATDGKLWTWGSNREGELGNGTGYNHQTASEVGNITQVVSVACGSSSCMVAHADGTVQGWGDDSSAELGNGVLNGSPTGVLPVQAVGLTSAAAVAGGFSGSLALLKDGTVQAWGRNDEGAGGTGSNSPATLLSPTPTLGLTGMTAVACGGGHRLALKNDGTVWTWGTNYSGVLGYTPAAGYSAVPTPVPGISGVVSIAGSGVHSMVCRNDGTVWVWGTGTDGELGLGTGTTSTVTPMQVPSLSGVTAVAAGFTHSLAIRNDGTIWAWGYNGNGQLGTGGTADSFVPVQVQGLTDVVAAAGGDRHSIALKSDGTVWAWGSNGSGELGNAVGSESHVPVQVLGLDEVTAISSGFGHNIALRKNGTAWTWGRNDLSQMGVAPVDSQPTPVLVAP